MDDFVPCELAVNLPIFRERVAPKNRSRRVILPDAEAGPSSLPLFHLGVVPGAILLDRWGREGLKPEISRMLFYLFLSYDLSSALAFYRSFFLGPEFPSGRIVVVSSLSACAAVSVAFQLGNIGAVLLVKNLSLDLSCLESIRACCCFKTTLYLRFLCLVRLVNPFSIVWLVCFYFFL